MPQHWPLRPLVVTGRIDDHTEAAVRRILHDEWRHFLQNALRDFLLLVLKVFASVLCAALQRFLFLVNLPLQVGLGFFVELVSLGGDLLLQGINFVVLGFQLVALGLEFLAQCIQVALAFVAAEDRLFNIDSANFHSAGIGAQCG